MHDTLKKQLASGRGIAPLFVIALGAGAATPAVAQEEAQDKDVYRLADASVELGAPKVYRGYEGVEVAVVPIASENEPARALVQVRRTGRSIDDKVLLHVVERGAGVDHHTLLDGRRSYTLRSRSSRWGGGDEHFLTVSPTETVRVYYDHESSEALDAAALLGEHLQLANGPELARLMTFDRDAAIARQSATFDDAVRRAREALGREVPAEIDWSTAPDEVLKRIDLGSYCAASLRAMTRLAERDEVYREALSRLERVRCDLGARAQLSLEDGTLRFTVAEEQANLGDFAFYSLMNALHQEE